MFLTSGNFATREQMKRLDKVIRFQGSYLVYQNPETDEQFAVTCDTPKSVLDMLSSSGYENTYSTADLTEVIDELPETVEVKIGDMNYTYHPHISHYYNMVVLELLDVDKENPYSVLKVFTGKRLMDAVIDSIEWIQSSRKGNFIIELPNDYITKKTQALL